MADASLSYSLRAHAALASHGFRFTRSLGQNFLLDDALVSEIISLAGVRPGDRIVEIGPGAGVMTALLADKGASVLAIELDNSLESVLQSVIGERENVKIEFADAMKADIPALLNAAYPSESGYSILTNLPYYITSDFVQKAVALNPPPKDIVLMVQKEAAERIMSEPNDKNWCAMAATVRYYAEPELLLNVPAQAFTPPPNVESALIRLKMRDVPVASPKDEGLFLRLIQAAFKMRRKTLLNNVTREFSISRESALEAFGATEIDERVRGEALSLQTLAALSDALGDIINK